tara:strand:+ start:6119 stop:7174 length:1056 start_codon:yes stop_codon:yes gene_type:complete
MIIQTNNVSHKIKVALVGVGHISKKHLNAINTLNDKMELVAVCESNKEILAQIELPKGTYLYSDFSEMINNCDIDVVSLCTPSGLHPEQTIEAAKKKINVITEKPMATTYPDAKKMINACKKNNVKLFVVKQNRFNPAVQLLKQSIAAQRFGNIILASLNVFWTRPQTYYDSADWRGTRRFDGGALMNQASHYVDLLKWLIGPVDSIQSFMSRHRDIEVEDTGVINIHHISGTLSSINYTMLTFPKNLEGSITILGEKGTVKISGNGLDRIDEWLFETKEDLDPDIEKMNQELPEFNKTSHVPYYQHVINAIKGRVDNYIDGEQGLHSLELMIAAEKSSKEQRIINLPLEK